MKDQWFHIGEEIARQLRESADKIDAGTWHRLTVDLKANTDGGTAVVKDLQVQRLE